MNRNVDALCATLITICISALPLYAAPVDNSTSNGVRQSTAHKPVKPQAKPKPVTVPNKPVPSSVAPVKPQDTATTTKPLVSPDQTNAIQDALKTLRKMDAATDVGVTQTNYQDRLIDAKAQVDEDLRSIPSGDIQAAITDSMQAYRDASVFWNACIELKSRASIQNGHSGQILTKYHLTLPDKGEAELHAFTRDHEECTMLQQDPATATTTVDRQDELVQRMYDESLAALDIDDPDQKRILSAIWTIGRQKEQDAEALLKSAIPAP